MCPSRYALLTAVSDFTIKSTNHRKIQQERLCNFLHTAHTGYREFVGEPDIFRIEAHFIEVEQQIESKLHMRAISVERVAYRDAVSHLQWALK